MAKQIWRVMGLSTQKPVIEVEADTYEEAVKIAKAMINKDVVVDIKKTSKK